MVVHENLAFSLKIQFANEKLSQEPLTNQAGLIIIASFPKPLPGHTG